MRQPSHTQNQPKLHKCTGVPLNPFIFGSLVQGGHIRQSDVDVMVVGEVDFCQVVSAFSTVQEALAREINPVVYSKDEFKSKAKQGAVT
jgi:predicted nucleotidyltransferase